MFRTHQWRIPALGLAILLSTLLINCAVPQFWIQKYRDMPDIGNLQEWRNSPKDKRTIVEKNECCEDYYIDHYGRRSSPHFEANPIELDESKLIVHGGVEIDEPASPHDSMAGVKLAFVHLSDVQLRDEQVRLYDKKTSERVDRIISSLERQPFIETFDGALYYAIVQSINATVESYRPEDPRRPLFMIHTGDAIDAGVMTELYEFIYISNELKLPWYNVIGNHDLGTFGNIAPEKIYVNDPFVEFMTIHSTLSFINMHHTVDDRYHAPKSPLNSGHDSTLLMGEALYSKFNGFDRLHYSPAEISTKLDFCDSCPGYYSLEVKSGNEGTKDPAIQMIVINTGFSFGAHGKIENDQFTWLKDEIERCSDKLTLVFGHHNIETIKNGTMLEDLFAGHPSVIAYFCGHKHSHKINYHPGPGGSFGFWEIITGAIFAYPQQGSIVMIGYDGTVGNVDLYAFDHTIEETYTDADGNIKESALFEHALLARKGATDDISQEKRAQIDSNKKDRYARLRFPYPVLD
jgi:3',5'-cyclic AMP phosphodiesterase CpdA